MKSKAVSEAVAIVGRIATVLLATSGTSAGDNGASLRRACGLVNASAEKVIVAGALGVLLFACFDAAREAGATLDGMGRVRSAIEAEQPDSVIAGVIVAGAVRMCLSQEARILTAMSLTSREDADRYAARMNAAFDAAQDAAADAGDNDVYRALVALRAAVIRDLSSRARQLPRVIEFRTRPATPALVLANRFYGDANRAAEVVAENKVVHPLFMPASGRALSA